MGIFDSLFSKKKKDSTTPKVKVEPNMHDYQKTVVSAESRESLLKHADTGRPVVISGGDFSSKTVIIVSKPSKYPNHTFDEKSYPVVTVDRLTIGTYEQVTFIGDIPQEEIDRLYEIEKQRRDAAEKEKDEFDKNQFKAEYEPHRYMRPAITQTKRSDAPKPKPKPIIKEEEEEEEEEKFPVYTLDAEGNMIPLEEPEEKPKPAPNSSWMTDEELTTFEESRKNQVKEAHFDMEVSEEETYIYKLNQLIASLPEFDFYNGDNDKDVSEDHPSVIAIRALQKEADEIMAHGEHFEADKNWTQAAICYEHLVARRYRNPQPYTKLLALYSKASLHASVKQKMQSLITNFFRDRREKMKAELLRLADKYDSTTYAEKCINEGECVTYYDGIYDIYNPYPVVEEVLMNIM